MVAPTPFRVPSPRERRKLVSNLHMNCSFIHNHFCTGAFVRSGEYRSFEAALCALLKASPQRRPAGRSRSPTYSLMKAVPESF